MANKKWFAVTGRFLFDDENTTYVYEADTAGDAIEMWEEEMKTEDSDNENDLIVITVLESETPIRIHYYGE